MANPFGNFFNKSHIKAYLSDDIDIGYNLYGPTLGLSGTITAIDKVLFINNITVIVRRLYDGATFTFSWFAFRPHRYSGSREFEIDLKMPAKFLIAANQAHTFNILFADQNQYSYMSSDIKLIKQHWEDVLEKFSIQNGSPETPKFFSSFLKREDTLSHYERLLRCCIWEEGNYALILAINPQETNSALEVHRLFSLTIQDIESLKANTAMILADVCRQPEISYHSAQTKLRI